MDIELQNRFTEAIEQLRKITTGEVSAQLKDPVAHMMLVALLHETEKIQHSIDSISERITDHFCEHFIPRENVCAMPALALVAPVFKRGKYGELADVEAGVTFTYRDDGSRIPLEYLPLFRGTLIPYDDVIVIARGRMVTKGKTMEVTMEKDNVVWLGISTQTEVECLKGVSFYITGQGDIAPERIAVVSQEATELQFSTMHRMEDIEMLEPFDGAQASGKLLSVMKYWKEYLQELPDAGLYYITDELTDRDIFKKRAFPKSFSSWLESEALDELDRNKDVLWLRIEYPEGYVVPTDFSVRLNTIPVVNVSVSTVTLTQTSPIAKLQKQDDSFFLQILEPTHDLRKQGHSVMDEEIVVRDFDASCYNNGDLCRDVRNLYNHFVEDYYAFIEYNALKDGEVIKSLRELINRIGSDVDRQNFSFTQKIRPNFDSGTYVMKNINRIPSVQMTKVSYMTTQGERGNLLQPQSAGDGSMWRRPLETRKMPLIEQAVPVIVGAWGGRDRASADSRYEQMRYYALTADRLYTRMDVEAFVRAELARIYVVKEEFRRIMVNVSINGCGGERAVERGLYVDIEFKDQKNYDKAVTESLQEQLRRKICNKSCIAMPIVIRLFNLEE